MDAPLSARRAKPHIARSTEKRGQIIVETVQVEQYARRVKLCKGYEGNDLRNLLQCPRAPRRGDGPRMVKPAGTKGPRVLRVCFRKRLRPRLYVSVIVSLPLSPSPAA